MTPDITPREAGCEAALAAILRILDDIDRHDPHPGHWVSTALIRSAIPGDVR